MVIIAWKNNLHPEIVAEGTEWNIIAQCLVYSVIIATLVTIVTMWCCMLS